MQMNTADYGSGSDGGDLSALDFLATSGDAPSGDDGSALDFSDLAPAADSGEGSFGDALEEYVPAETDDGLDTGIESLAEGEEEDEIPDLLVTVTNPAGTVSIRAAADGGPVLFELAPSVVSMTESDLADEVTVIAELARQKGLSVVHEYMHSLFSQLGVDGPEDQIALNNLLEAGMGVTSPEQANEAQAEVFATRYGNDG